MANHIKNFSPIGLTIPFINSNNGYFAQSFDTNTQVKQNLVNFLKTKKGERRMSSLFGTRLYEILFEQIDSNTVEIMKNIISEEIKQWIPEISIRKIEIIENISENKFLCSIDYIVLSTQSVDNLSFSINNPNI